MFFYEVEGHMQKLSSFRRGKKIWPKKSLTWFLQVPLRLLPVLSWKCMILFEFFFHPSNRDEVFVWETLHAGYQDLGHRNTRSQ